MASSILKKKKRKEKPTQTKQANEVGSWEICRQWTFHSEENTAEFLSGLQEWGSIAKND